MSRAAIVDAIAADTRLTALGFHKETSPTAKDATILMNYSADQRPSDTLFMVLAFGDETPILRSGDGWTRNQRPVTIWVHQYKEYSTDYAHIDGVLNILDEIMLGLVHVDGGDGYTLTLAEENGRSRDLRDRTYDTICRSISYRILSRETESV